ncbi:branched-chain amino acid ABC transporter permease [Bradyrhizobium sp. Cp5.3]|uniref:branched-chain amino acid ABC transporter permease n=1 Tax=Bradyrhizobium sp. Cp5.3 TaxID=443598 RepID=UPI0018DB648F|nr:branched-chain amino acid ABC transporter permease [Bradyrhizobium sp. Cp5.3]
MTLVLDAVLSGFLLGAFYAALAVGVTITFGMLDVPNISHPAFTVLGAFLVFTANQTFGLDPILAALVVALAFFIVGAALYKIYHISFEVRGQDPLRGLTFFFGCMFMLEMALSLVFGVDIRTVNVAYAKGILRIGDSVVPFRLLVPAIASLGLLSAIYIGLHRTFFGRAILAGSQDQFALRLMGVDPIKMRQIAFGVAYASAAISGGLLIIIQPVTPLAGEAFIGTVFAICVLGGLTSTLGTLIGAVLLGLSESIIGTFFGPSWAPAVAFGLLLIVLAVRPQGLLGR